MKGHHLYHHSPKGANAGYGLTSGFWDAVWNTRFPAEERRALYRRKKKTTPWRTKRPPQDTRPAGPTIRLGC